MKFLSALIFITGASFGANFAQFKGKFFVLQLDGSPHLAATAEISETPTDYVFQLSNLPQTFKAVTELSVSFAKADTKIKADQNILSLENTKGSFEFRDEKDRFEVSYLPVGGNTSKYLVTKGGAPGKLLNARDFFKPLEGYYTIEMLNGGKPKASIAHYEIDLATDNTEAGVYAPYCAPVSKVCDAGYHGFKYDNAKVFETKLANGNLFYYILEDEAGQVRYTTYEFQNDQLIARNYQYLFLNKVFFVEHKLKKAEIL